MKATHGDPPLGGDDGTSGSSTGSSRRSEQQKVDLSPTAWRSSVLKEAAERRRSNCRKPTETTIPAVRHGNRARPSSLEEKLTRAEFERMTADLLTGARTVRDGDLRRGHRRLQDPPRHPVGGSTRMPMVQSCAQGDRPGATRHKGVNPDEVVAVGAAIQAAC